MESQHVSKLSQEIAMYVSNEGKDTTEFLKGSGLFRTDVVSDGTMKVNRLLPNGRTLHVLHNYQRKELNVLVYPNKDTETFTYRSEEINYTGDFSELQIEKSILRREDVQGPRLVTLQERYQEFMENVRDVITEKSSELHDLRL